VSKGFRILVRLDEISRKYYTWDIVNDRPTDTSIDWSVVNFDTSKDPYEDFMRRNL
jgi:hypothetical protein